MRNDNKFENAFDDKATKSVPDHNKKGRRKKKSYVKPTATKAEAPKGCSKGSANGSVITKFGTNNVKWYQNVPGYENWASISWAKILGNDVTLQGSQYTVKNALEEETIINPAYTPTLVPGIMKLEFAPTFGNVTNNQDPINIAGQYVMSDIRSKLRATNRYDRSELIMLIGAMSSVYMWYEDVCRAYKTVAFYNSESRYQPDALCTALGYSHQFLMENINDIQGFLKIAAYKIASINIPDIFDYINRQKWMVENVYADSEDKRSQLYVFQPQYFYVWKEGVNDEPTHLQAETRATVFNLGPSAGPDSVVKSMDQLWFALEHLLGPLLGSGDVGDISGDIANAYGDSDLVKLSCPSEEPITFIVDAEVGNEISNLTCPCPMIYQDKVEQKLTDLVAGPYVTAKPLVKARLENEYYNPDLFLASFQNMDYMLNADGMEQSPSTVLTSTRLMCTYEGYGKTASGVKAGANLVASGSEIVVNVKIFTRQVDGSIQIRPFNTVQIVAQSGAHAVDVFHTFVLDQILSASFRWKPTQYVYSAASAGVENGHVKLSGPVQYEGIICSTQQYAKMPANTLRDISDYCMVSLFTPDK